MERAPNTDTAPDESPLQAEIARLNKIIRALVKRAESSTELQGSDFTLFQTALMLEDQVRSRTAALEELLAEKEKIRLELSKSEEKFSALFNLHPDPLVLTRLSDGIVLEVSNSVVRHFGYRPEEIVGRNALGGSLGIWVDAEAKRQWRARLERDRAVSGFETTMRHRDGSTIPMLLAGTVIDIGGEPCVITVAHDISRRLAVEKALRKSEAKFSAIFSLTPDPITLARLEDGVVLEASQSFARFFGYTPEQVVGHSTLPGDLGIWVDPGQRRQWCDLIERDGQVLGYETRMRRADGSIAAVLVSGKAVDLDGVRCVVANAHDITDQKEYADRMRQIAQHDPLTGLPNRLLLGDRLRQAIAQCDREGTRAAVCYIDLDGFKDLNDRLGHQIGDQILNEVAVRLSAAVRGPDTVARLGGDEFVVVLCGLTSDDEWRQAVDRLLDVCAGPYRVAGTQERGISASIGVTVFPDDRADPDTLVRHADHAMYVAKQAGKNRYQFFDTGLEQRVEARHATLRRLGEALRAGQFRLHFQPKVDCRQGRVVGAEALLRWQHPTLGQLSPAEFVPLIENSELALDVGDWVFRETMAQMMRWRHAGLDLTVSANAFIRQLVQRDFAHSLASLLAQFPDLDPRKLQIEIVETAALNELETMRQVIDECRQLGVAFSLDDFGTGYSTLAHLRHLPATEIKIDHSFVRHMLSRGEDMVMVEAVIGLGRAFGRSVVAEGAETPAHIGRLLALGCDVMQGYALARPMPAEDFLRWAAAFRPDPNWFARQEEPGGPQAPSAIGETS